MIFSQFDKKTKAILTCVAFFIITGCTTTKPPNPDYDKMIHLEFIDRKISHFYMYGYKLDAPIIEKEQKMNFSKGVMKFKIKSSECTNFTACEPDDLNIHIDIQYDEMNAKFNELKEIDKAKVDLNQFKLKSFNISKEIIVSETNRTHYLFQDNLAIPFHVEIKYIKKN